jgi:hypothetical protein
MGRVAKNDAMSTKTLGFGELGAPKDVLVEESRPAGPFYRLIVSHIENVIDLQPLPLPRYLAPRC